MDLFSYLQVLFLKKFIVHFPALFCDTENMPTQIFLMEII